MPKQSQCDSIPSSTESPRLRVLLVEDSPVVALDLQEALMERGFLVVGPADTQAEALSLLSTNPVDLAILDFRLSDGNSLALARELKTRGVRVVFHTGHDPEFLNPEFSDCKYLVKPVSFSELFAALEQS